MGEVVLHVLTAVSIPLVFVLCIWLCDHGGTDRNAVRSIRRRAIGALLATGYSLLITACVTGTSDLPAPHGHYGFGSVVFATLAALLLTVTLFIGPLAVDAMQSWQAPPNRDAQSPLTRMRQTAHSWKVVRELIVVSELG